MAKAPEPDWTGIHKQLQTHKDLTLQLVWQEGRESNPEGYGYSRFCDLYRRWLKKLDLVLRQEHRAGEKMFVDYAGATIPIHNPETGEAHPTAVFVAVLGCQQLHLRRGQDGTGSAELDRFAYAGPGVFRQCGRGRGAG